MKPTRYQKSSSNQKSNYTVEYRIDGVTGFLLSKKNLSTFEEAQKEREDLIRMGASEALIKRQS